MVTYVEQMARLGVPRFHRFFYLQHVYASLDYLQREYILYVLG